MLPDLVVVSGIRSSAVERLTRSMCRFDDTAGVAHNVRAAEHGAVHRWLRRGGTEHIESIEVPPAEVSDAVRDDLRGVLGELVTDPAVRRIVLPLDPALEPGPVCRELLGPVGGDTELANQVRMRGVLTVVDEPTWLADATGTASLAERAFALGPQDSRTVAQVAVAQVECADAIVLSGRADVATAVRTGAVLDRLAPSARRRRARAQEDAAWMLDDLESGGTAARTSPDVHGRLLRGEPLLGCDAGVRWLLFSSALPLHPERLHDLVPELLRWSVRSRGRIWLAGRPDEVLWCESAGGGMRVESVDRWLAAGDAATWATADPQRRTFASLRWLPYFGDRSQDLAVLVHSDRGPDLAAGLRAAQLTRAEMIAGPGAWRRWFDPFGATHIDPCPVLSQHQAGTSAPHMVPGRG